MVNATRRIVRKDNPSLPKQDEPQAFERSEEPIVEPLAGVSVDTIPPEPEEIKLVPAAQEPNLVPATVLGPAIVVPAEPEEVVIEHVEPAIKIPEFTEEELAKSAEHLKPKEEVVDEPPKEVVKEIPKIPKIVNAKREVFPPIPFEFWKP